MINIYIIIKRYKEKLVGVIQVYVPNSMRQILCAKFYAIICSAISRIFDDKY